jgi:hypothetical protein
MISRPITYIEPHVLLVEEYLSSEQDADYWESPDIAEVRSAIKVHYVEEQAYRSCYCGTSIRTSHGRVWDVEHVVSRSTHPHFMFEPENLAAACIDCNTAKSNQNVLVNPRVKKYPRRSGAYLIVHPHFDDYNQHIAVAFERIYIPKTKKGEKTIILCRLTRFAYEYMGWDSGLADEPRLLEALTKFMNTRNPDVLNEILMLAQIRTSRTLLG